MTRAKRKKPLSDSQRDALKLGELIRNIVCLDSIANRFFEDDLRKQVRAIADEQMHRLGRESITEHRDRIFNTHANLGNNEWEWPEPSFYRYQKLETKS